LARHLKYTSRHLDDLVRNATSGDERALDSLLRHFQDPLLAFIRATLKTDRAGAPQAEDVLQETFIQAIRSVRKIEPRGHEAFLAWIKSVARTRFINLVNARKAKKREGGRLFVASRADAEASATRILELVAGVDRTPSRIAVRKEAIGAMMMALARLDTARREIIDLRFAKGMEPKEVASVRAPGRSKC
jgi:RNA polymerase sigma factor (sigma-70 family)